MKILLFMSVFWIVYGVLGLFGIQNIPKKIKSTEYEKEYKRFAGTSWLMVGVPWFVVWLITHNIDISAHIVILIMVACAVPAILYTHIGEKKYRALLKK